MVVLAALLAGPSPLPDPSPDDRAAVMTSLLNGLAGDQRIPHRRPAGRPICVVAELSPSPMAGHRQPDPGDRKFDAPIGRPRLPWKKDTEEEARARLWWVDPELSADDKRRQTAIQDAALLASERPVENLPHRRIDQAWLTPNQTLASGACPETIELSEPDIALDHAFIDVTIDCGDLCGLGALYVMRRQNGMWTVVDGRTAFIS